MRGAQPALGDPRQSHPRKTRGDLAHPRSKLLNNAADLWRRGAETGGLGHRGDTRGLLSKPGLLWARAAQGTERTGVIFWHCRSASQRLEQFKLRRHYTQHQVRTVPCSPLVTTSSISEQRPWSHTPYYGHQLLPAREKVDPERFFKGLKKPYAGDFCLFDFWVFLRQGLTM